MKNRSTPSVLVHQFWFSGLSDAFLFDQFR